MNKNQEDRLSMFNAVRTTCETNRDAWNANAIFKAGYDLWLDTIMGIEENSQTQSTIISGYTIDKASKRENMINKALFIANRIQSYANVTHNHILLNSVKYTPSDLKKSRDSDSVGMCEIIYNLASGITTELLPYGVTAEMITDLQTAINDFIESLSMPTVMIATIKVATDNIARLFKEADGLLTNRMDLDIELFRTSYPDFYSQYQIARNIISTGNRAVSVMGNVTLAETGEAMKGAVLSFVLQPMGLMATEEVKPLVKKSAAKGNFRIASLPEGNYTVTVKKIGFKEQVLSVIVADGETSKVKVKMEKI